MSVGAVVAGGVVLHAVRSSSEPPTTLGYVQGIAVQLRLVAIDGRGHKLRDVAALNFQAMYLAALTAGVELVVTSAFRTMEEQQRLYDGYVKHLPGFNLAARPGYSNHQGGTAVDVETLEGTNAAFNWLTANAGAYGFARTVAAEPWHWELL